MTGRRVVGVQPQRSFGVLDGLGGIALQQCAEGGIVKRLGLEVTVVGLVQHSAKSGARRFSVSRRKQRAALVVQGDRGLVRVRCSFAEQDCRLFSVVVSERLGAFHELGLGVRLGKGHMG